MRFTIAAVICATFTFSATSAKAEMDPRQIYYGGAAAIAIFAANSAAVVGNAVAIGTSQRTFAKRLAWGLPGVIAGGASLASMAVVNDGAAFRNPAGYVLVVPAVASLLLGATNLALPHAAQAVAVVPTAIPTGRASTAPGLAFAMRF